MRIGIDIDGVLADVLLYELDVANKYAVLNNLGSVKNPNGYSCSEIFDITQAKEDDFWNVAIKEYINIPARKFADEVTAKLKEEGHEIFIVTARTNNLSYTDISAEEMKKHVQNWLKENNIVYDKIVWTKKEKLSACKENQIDVLVEDKPSNIKQVASIIPVMVYDHRYNADIEGKNIIRVFSWYDIYYKIHNLNNKQ